jgi:hypothetical protein
MSYFKEPVKIIYFLLFYFSALKKFAKYYLLKILITRSGENLKIKKKKNII